MWSRIFEGRQLTQRGNEEQKLEVTFLRCSTVDHGILTLDQTDWQVEWKSFEIRSGD
jgi:hypothetical protein